MIWVWILIGFVVGEGSMAGVWYWMEKKRKRQKEVQDKGRVVIPLRDMVQLANINTAMDVGYLMLEYKINLKIPEFYDKYMNLVKKQKELYFRDIFFFIVTKNLDQFPKIQFFLLLDQIHILVIKLRNFQIYFILQHQITDIHRRIDISQLYHIPGAESLPCLYPELPFAVSVFSPSNTTLRPYSLPPRQIQSKSTPKS